MHHELFSPEVCILRLLVVGHSYLTAFAQQKYIAMKRLRPDLDIKILTPRLMRHLFGIYERKRAPGFSETEIPDIRSFFEGSHMSYALDPLNFISILKNFKPDRIHIEEDPYSVVGFETVFLARLFCPQAKISFFLWDNLARTSRFPLGLIKSCLNRYGLKRSELIICGNREGELLLREKKGYTGRAAVLPQVACNKTAYENAKNLRPSLNLPEGAVLIGFIGRLIPEKGVFLLLEALLCLEDLPWCLLLLGAGPLETEIADKWVPRFVNRLICRKAVPHAEVPSYVKALDILTLPSYSTPRWKEQFGLVLAEAMILGVPCIGSSSGAIPEVIGPGGLIFKEGDIEELVKNLRKMIMDQNLRHALGVKARAFANSHYTVDALASAYLEQFGWPTSISSIIEKADT